MRIKNFSFIVMAMLFSLVWTSCDKAQTELTIDDIKTNATISGSVARPIGQAYNEGKFVDNYGPAVGAVVSVEVPYNNYKQGAVGNKVFTTTVGADGLYSITFPFAKTGNISIKCADFIGTQNLFDKMNGATPVFKTENVLFSTQALTPSISAGSITSLPRITYMATPIDVINTMKESVRITDTIFIATETLEGTGAQRRLVGTFAPLAEKEVKVRVVYDNISGPNNGYECYYGAVTDIKGVFILDIPVIRKFGSFEVNIMVADFIPNANFSHRYQDAGIWTDESLGGFYTMHQNSRVARNVNLVNLDLMYILPNSKMEFIPFNPNQVHNWNAYLWDFR